jgi:hypothetical protein
VVFIARTIGRILGKSCDKLSLMRSFPKKKAGGEGWLAAVEDMRRMKSEVLIILVLAAALAMHRREPSPACGPSGCWILPPDFHPPAHFPNTSAVPPIEGIAAANPDAPR